MLLATVLGSGMAMLDSTVVNLALPSMRNDLGADFTQVQWIVTGYTLSLAALVLVGGALGDRFGRRRVFVTGVLWFTTASVVCAVAPTIDVLIAARVVQGVGGALLAPGSLALIQSSFAPADRARAIGAWSGLGGVAAAIGPFVGGWLVDIGSWRWIFLINLPLGVVVAVVAVRHVPDSRDEDSGRAIDGWGAVTGALALAATSYGLSTQRWTVMGAGLALLVAFVVVESRVATPMLPLSVFRSRVFSATNVVTFLLYGALAVGLFLLGLVLQEALGYSPLRAGVATLPLTLLMLTFSARSGALAQRIGARIPMTIGPVVVAAGLALLTRIDVGAHYLTDVLPGVVVFGAGLCLTVAPLTTTALGAVDERHAGIASGVSNAVARTGQLVAVSAVPVLAGFAPDATIDANTLVDGLHRVVWIAAAVTATAGALSWLGLAGTAVDGPSGGRPDSVEPPYHCAAGGPPAPADEALPSRGV